MLVNPAPAEEGRPERLQKLLADLGRDIYPQLPSAVFAEPIALDGYAQQLRRNALVVGGLALFVGLTKVPNKLGALGIDFDGKAEPVGYALLAVLGYQALHFVSATWRNRRETWEKTRAADELYLAARYELGLVERCHAQMKDRIPEPTQRLLTSWSRRGRLRVAPAGRHRVVHWFRAILEYDFPGVLALAGAASLGWALTRPPPVSPPAPPKPPNQVVKPPPFEGGVPVPSGPPRPAGPKHSG